MKILISLLLGLIVLLILVVAVAEVMRRNAQEKQVTRKWTDPKFHD